MDHHALNALALPSSRQCENERSIGRETSSLAQLSKNKLPILQPLFHNHRQRSQHSF